MSRFRDKLRHAFAVEPDGDAQPTPQQQRPVDWLCRQAARRHLTTPGLVVLEMMHPLNYVGAMSMHFFSPAVWAVAPRAFHGHYRELATFLEQRGSLPYVAKRLEFFEEQYGRRADKHSDHGAIDP
jgi:hypothetical protein